MVDSASGRVDMSRLACSTITFRRFGLAGALRAIAELGIGWVEPAAFPGFALHFDLLGATSAAEDEFVATVEGSGLRACSINTSVGPFNEAGTDFAVWHEAARRVMRVARRLGARAISVAGGRPIDRTHESLDANIGLMAEHIRLICEEAQSMGLVVSIEAPHAGGLVKNAPEAMTLQSRVGHPNCKLIFDANHHFRSGWSMADSVRLIGGGIDHVHLRDRRGESQACAIGEGETRFEELFASLEAINYQGVYSFEIPDAGETIEQAKQTLRRSMEFLAALRWDGR